MESTSLPQVSLLGATGRLGHLITEIHAASHANGRTRDFFLKPALRDSTSSRSLDLPDLLRSRLILDVSSPEAVCDFIRFALQAPSDPLPVLLVGSTGWDVQGSAKFREDLVRYAEKALVIRAPNFSLGVELVRQILETFHPHFQALGYEAKMIETHHAQKKDAPSGTALLLNQITQCEVESIREGAHPGEHRVLYSTPFEQIEITHRAFDRKVFAQGALFAVRQALSLPLPSRGMIHIRDLLNLASASRPSLRFSD